MEEHGFLGAGMKFPPQADRATGRFAVSRGKESVKESVYLILMTQKTERLMRPDFGSSLMSYTFMDTGMTSVNMMVRDLTWQILKGEPRIRDVEITVDSKAKEGCLLINVDYTIRSSNVRDNLVFPFYLNVRS